MKQRLVILTLSLAALAVGLLGLSCTTNQNTNGNRGDNTNTAEATAKPPVTPPATPSGPDPCSAPTIPDLTAAIEANFQHSPLKDQYAQHMFKFDVVSDTTMQPPTYKMRLEGMMGNSMAMNHLTQVLDRIFKRNCLNKVIFVPKGTLPAKPNAQINEDDFFTWFACEDPTIPCAGGKCVLPSECPGPTPTPDANTNANRKAVVPESKPGNGSNWKVSNANH